MSDTSVSTPPWLSQPITVVVADDHPLWRDAVARDLTEAGFEVVATASDGRQALDAVLATGPMVLVTDLQMPMLAGVDLTRQITECCPNVRILVVSASGEQPDVVEAIKAGATGYLVKSASREELTAAVRHTAAGDPVFTPGIAGLVLGEFRRMATSVRAAGNAGTSKTANALAEDGSALTERETEVLQLVATGMSYRQIAQRLVLSHRTVQNHVQNILGKLQLHSRVELVRYAVKRGLDE